MADGDGHRFDCLHGAAEEDDHEVALGDRLPDGPLPPNGIRDEVHVLPEWWPSVEGRNEVGAWLCVGILL